MSWKNPGMNSLANNTYIFFSRFFVLIGYYKILTSVPVLHSRSLLFTHFIDSSAYLLVPNSNCICLHSCFPKTSQTLRACAEMWLWKEVSLNCVNYMKTVAGVQTRWSARSVISKEKFTAGFTYLHITNLPLMGMATCSHRASLVFKEVTSSSQPGIWPLLVSTLSSRTTQALRLFTTFTNHPTSTHSAFPARSDSETSSALCSWTPVYYSYGIPDLHRAHFQK